MPDWMSKHNPENFGGDLKTDISLSHTADDRFHPSHSLLWPTVKYPSAKRNVYIKHLV